jgi:hypothetical protein
VRANQGILAGKSSDQSHTLDRADPQAVVTYISRTNQARFKVFCAAMAASSTHRPGTWGLAMKEET